MMKTSRCLAAAVAALALSAATGTAARAANPVIPKPGAASGPIPFSPVSKDGTDAAVARSLVPDMLAAKGAVIKIAVVHQDVTGVPGLMIRDEAKDRCRDGACRTVFAMPRGQGWAVVFDRPARTVEFGKDGFGTVKQIVVDGGYEVWEWTGHTYHANIAAAGQVFALTEPSAAAIPQLVEAFGKGAKTLSEKTRGVSVKAAFVELGEKGGKQILVQIDGPGVCGIRLGCPWRLLEVKNNAYKTLLFGHGQGAIAALAVSRGGWRDIASETPKGFVTYGWTGKEYATSESVADKRGN